MDRERHQPWPPGAGVRRGTVAATLVVAMLTCVPAAAAADQSVRLRSSFEGQTTTATLTIPDDWKVQARTAGVKLTAPSSRDGCSHVLQADLDQLYVAGTVTSAAWVKTRLKGRGGLVAVGPVADYSWGVAMRDGARESTGVGARIVGTGRYGPILSELQASTSLTGDCPDTQGARAARRLARVLSGLSLVATRRRSTGRTARSTPRRPG